jgi:CBS domain containing-hemolysin-like protein
MTTGVLLAYLALAVASLVASAFFSGVETGAYSVNRLRLSVRAERGERRARVLIEELAQANRWLATLLIGNTLAGDAASYAIGHLLDGAGVSHGTAMVLNAAILLPLIVVFGETLPKELFRQHADAWMIVVAPAARWVRRIIGLTGAVAFVRWFGEALAARFGLTQGEAIDARQRVIELMQEGQGAVDERQVAMASRLLALSRRSAQELMTPWRRVRTISEDALPQVVREILRSRPHACYPVTEVGGACCGTVAAIDLLADPSAGVSGALRAPVTVAPTTPALEVLCALRQSGASLAVVVDGGRPQGVLGVRDVLEPVIGRLSAW